MWYHLILVFCIIDGGAISLSNGKLSTYINALTKARFAIDEIVEESYDDIIQLYKNSGLAKKSK